MFFKGYKQSEEHKRKIGDALRGKAKSKEHGERISLAKIGKPSVFKGKHHSAEARHKLRLANLGKTYSDEYKRKQSESHKGEKHYNWKGGITPQNARIRRSMEYRLWRDAVYKRDNYTCVWCGETKSGSFHADHIKPFAQYPELRFAIDNGRTLCVECHKTTPTYGNRKFQPGVIK